MSSSRIFCVERKALQTARLAAVGGLEQVMLTALMMPHSPLLPTAVFVVAFAGLEHLRQRETWQDM